MLTRPSPRAPARATRHAGRPHAHAPARRPLPPLRAGGGGGGAFGAWKDLAEFVAGSGASAGGPFEGLTDRIGRDVYIDIAGWHLYLRDVRVGNATLAAGLAAQLGAAASAGEDPATAVAATLAALPVSLGGGKATVALADAVPACAVGDLVRAVEDFGRGKL